jgi:putative ABC transport system permease protein
MNKQHSLHETVEHPPVRVVTFPEIRSKTDMHDLRLALRLLRRNPGFTIVAVLALALGIGANTAIFSVVDAVLLKQLPYEQPERIALVWEDATHQGFPLNNAAPANWIDWREQNTVFSDIAAMRWSAVNLLGEGTPENLIGNRVTPDFWRVMGAKAARGRVFYAEEEKRNAKVVVISHGLWRRRFGAEPSIVGRKVILSDQPYEIVGVMPPGFVFPDRRVELWTPSDLSPQNLAQRGSHYLTCVARLKPGATMEQAQSEMTVIMKRLEARYPDTNKQIGIRVVPLREHLAGKLKVALWVLLGAAGCVLLIACANLANLLLARATGRQQEMAVRAALGAGKGRIIRQMLMESVLLSAIGAAAGLVVARLAMLALEKLVPSGLDKPDLTLDGRVLIFTVVLTALTGIVFGLAPALAAARSDLQDALKQGGRGSAGSRRQWFRDSLVLGETALAMMLLTGAGLMIQTLVRLQRTDLGMRTDHLLTLSTMLPDSRYQTFAKRETFFNAVVEKVRAIPGVVDAGYTSSLPLTSMGNTSSYRIEGQAEWVRDQDALFRVITPGFFSAGGARRREGRFFTEDDRSATLQVAIINETFADKHWPGQSALGKRFCTRCGSGSDELPAIWMTVVGVVKEIRERGIDVPLKMAMYTPLAQSANYWPTPDDLVVRTSVLPESVTNAVRQAIWSLDKDQPVERIRRMTAVAEEELAPRRQQMIVLVTFAAVALLLASLGIYGVLSYAVTQRTPEIGVRVSLGATPRNILGLVLYRGVTLTAAGLFLGLLGSLGVGRLMSTLLFEVKEQDPVILAGVSVILLAVAMAACLIPAYRASRVDPMVALRNE